LIELSKQLHADAPARWTKWVKTNRDLNDARDAEIKEKSKEPSDAFCNPLAVVSVLEEVMSDDAVIVADGGDFIATASYVVRPRTPLSWLDPGPFGTLGVGGGFAIGAAVTRVGAEVWLLYGDGSSAYSLAEFDTYRRHKIPVIAVIGNDAAWMQMYRGQVEFFGDDVATKLEYTDYQEVAKAYGGSDVYAAVVRRIEDLHPALMEAKQACKQGRSALVNVLIGKTAFRQGSISV
jgi:thiamine pyrophosphate-dependent acetolactate synthase large subunit-like protein